MVNGIGLAKIFGKYKSRVSNPKVRIIFPETRLKREPELVLKKPICQYVGDKNFPSRGINVAAAEKVAGGVRSQIV